MTSKDKSTFSNRTFQALIRSRATFGFSSEAVNYLKLKLEDIIDMTIKEAERIHLEANKKNVLEGKKEIVRVPYGIMRKAVEEVISRFIQDKL